MRRVHKIILPLFLTVSLANCSGENGGDFPDSDAPEWGNAMLVESGTGTARSPRVIFDSNDTAVAVWIQDDFADFSVFSNRDLSSGWGAEERIESRIFDASQPWIAASGNGNAIAVWAHNDRDAQRFVLANWYEDGTGWEVEEQINSRFGTVLSPHVVADENGNALTVWTFTDGNLSIYSNHYTTNGGWDLEEPIESGDGAAYGPEIAMDDQGNAVAVWSQDDGNGVFSIYANHYIPDQGWQEEVLIESGSGTTRHDDLSVYLDVDMDVDGNAVAVWSQKDGNNIFSIYANRYTPDEGWDNERIIESGTETAKYVAVDMDPTGNAFVVWEQDDNAFSDVSSIYSNRYDLEAADWESEQLIERSNLNAVYPEIQTDPDGNAVAVWIQGDSTGSLYSNLYVIKENAGWGTEKLVETSPGRVDQNNPLSLAIDSEGNAILVWAQEELTGSGRYSIYSNRFE